MVNNKFKIGDRVRIIDTSTIESYELNKIGILVEIRDIYNDGSYVQYVVDMGRPRREREPENTRWYLRKSCIERVIIKNEQLVFEFMLE